MPVNSCPQHYTVKDGDTLGALADTCGTTSVSLAKMNEQITKSDENGDKRSRTPTGDLIYTGEVIYTGCPISDQYRNAEFSYTDCTDMFRMAWSQPLLHKHPLDTEGKVIFTPLDRSPLALTK